MSKGKAINAIVFRRILIALFAAMILGAIGLVMFGMNLLRTTAADVNSVVTQSTTLNQTNSQTVREWNELERNKDVVERVSQIVAESKSYAYQDVIVRDLNSFADKAGIKITNFTFTQEGRTSGSRSSASSGGSADTPQPPISSATGGLKTTSVSITIETPVDYNRLLSFIHYVEQNLTKMQVASISLSRASDEQPGMVTPDSLTVEVYIR